MRDRNFVQKPKPKPQSGMSLIETTIALAMLLIVAGGIMSLAAVAISTTETQGHLASRTAEYAQDKMEQLLSLNFCDGGTTGTGGTDTTVFPMTAGAGTGLAGCSNPGAAIPTALTGGGLDTKNPTAGFVDYLDSGGNLVAANQTWEYIRVWQISIPNDAGGNPIPGLKQVTVTTTVKQSVGNPTIVPRSTVSALKSYLL